MTRTSMMAFIITIAAFISANAYADDYVITLKDHQFTPADITLPANQVVKLIVKNEQTTPAEFESSELDREKVVKPGSSITINLAPLKAGTYGYHDDFHDETKGTITVK